MTSPHLGGTARRQVGRTPPISPASAASARSSPKTTVGTGDRWVLSNAIDDRLGWMPHPEYRVLRILFRYAGEDCKAWPGQTRIATACGCSQPTVSRRLCRLVKWDILEVVRRGHKGSRKAGEYRIRAPSEWPRARPD